MRRQMCTFALFALFTSGQVLTQDEPREWKKTGLALRFVSKLGYRSSSHRVHFQSEFIYREKFQSR